MIRLAIHPLLDHIKRREPHASIQRETDQIVYTKRYDEMEFSTFFRIMPDGTMLQVLTFFPFSLAHANLGDVARLLHLLNKQLDVPGFGIDEMSGVIFFRQMIPSLDRKLDPVLLDTYVQAINNVCEVFGQPIGVMASGSLSFDEIVEQLQNQQGAPAGV